MKFRLCLIYAVAACVSAVSVGSLSAQKLVIVATNDTHSQIDPSDEDGMGGILRRKVVVDSIRDVNDNVLLVDLGDPVQGTMFFNMYKGEVENLLMNRLGYDIRILGNHEFDNGIDELARNLKGVTADMISTNYRFDHPELAAKFRPYVIKEIGGRKVAFIGVNLQPKGMIADDNYVGLNYLDAFTAANATAWHLKHNEGVDKVVALTHIGYEASGTGTSDKELAASSTDIDVILGGHSHTLLNPADATGKSGPWKLPTADADSVVVTQAGKGGRYVAVVTLDLDSDEVGYEIIPVDSRYDSRIDPVLDAVIEPYRRGMEEVKRKVVGKTAFALDKDSPALLNLVADFLRDRGRQLADSVDFAIVNKGGIRRGLPKGNVTQEQIQTMLPFNNTVVVLELTGRDILDNFKVMAATAGNGLSDEVRVSYNPETGDIESATLNGRPIEPDKVYRLATIDYLANGGDYMKPLTRGRRIASSDVILYEDFVDALTNGIYKGKTLRPSTEVRFDKTR